MDTLYGAKTKALSKTQVIRDMTILDVIRDGTDSDGHARVRILWGDYDDQGIATLSKKYFTSGHKEMDKALMRYVDLLEESYRMPVSDMVGLQYLAERVKEDGSYWIAKPLQVSASLYQTWEASLYIGSRGTIEKMVITGGERVQAPELEALVTEARKKFDLLIMTN